MSKQIKERELTVAINDIGRDSVWNSASSHDKTGDDEEHLSKPHSGCKGKV
jgi:hypothetical protein